MFWNFLQIFYIILENLRIIIFLQFKANLSPVYFPKYVGGLVGWLVGSVLMAYKPL